jgi:hypothetical protein
VSLVLSTAAGLLAGQDLFLSADKVLEYFSVTKGDLVNALGAELARSVDWF